LSSRGSPGLSTIPGGGSHRPASVPRPMVARSNAAIPFNRDNRAPGCTVSPCDLGTIAGGKVARANRLDDMAEGVRLAGRFKCFTLQGKRLIVLIGGRFFTRKGGQSNHRERVAGAGGTVRWTTGRYIQLVPTTGLYVYVLETQYNISD
jgi:hypothetical protein